MQYEDRELTCRDCGASFTFTARDQEFYEQQSPPFEPPKRCKPCRLKKKQRFGRNENEGYRE